MANDENKSRTIGKVDFEEARDRGRRSWERWRPAYQLAESDLQFIVGNHWTRDELNERGTGRITLTINDVGQYLDKVNGDMRMNPTAVNVIPADFGAAQAKFLSSTGKKYEGHEVIAGLVRQIEYKSGAKDHYNLAGQHATESGLGWLRVYTDWADQNSFDQSLKVERIKNRFSVLIDPMITEPDGSDQNYCFIRDWVKMDDFRKEHPEASPGVITGGESMSAMWGMEGYVAVSEYYWRETFQMQIAQLRDGSIINDGSHLRDEEQKREAVRLWDLAKAGDHFYRDRKQTCYRIKWAKVTYHDTLAGPFELPGTIIPVAPVWGKRVEGDEDTYVYGLVRFAKDPKRMENYWLSSATEKVGMGTKAPYLLTPDQIDGHEVQWQNANRGLPPYLLFNPDPTGKVPPPSRTVPTPMPAAEVSMFMTMREMTKGAIGLHDAAVGKDTNKQSGRALLALEQQANVGSFVFTDNLRMAVSYVGRVFLEWLPKVYGKERLISIRHPNGEVDTIPVNRIVDGKLVNDLTQGVYDQHVTTGPAYSTLRQEAVANMGDLFKAAPTFLPAMADIWFSNMDYPGAQQMAKRARKMVPRQLLDETELTEEERNAPPPQPTPEEQALMAESEAKMATAQATTAKAEGTIATAEADKVQAQAKIATAEADVTISRDRVEGQRQATISQQVEAATPKEEPKPDATAEDAPVTRDDFEAFKTEMAQALNGVLQAVKSIKGATP